MMNTRPFKNKSEYDPGRFRTVIEFMRQVSEKNSSGGSKPLPVTIKSTKVLELAVREGDQLVLSAGVVNLDEARYMVMRKDKNFVAKKNMLLKKGDSFYTVRAIIPLDEPTQYLKFLAVIKDGQN